jgi:hypothetical protein
LPRVSPATFALGFVALAVLATGLTGCDQSSDEDADQDASVPLGGPFPIRVDPAPDSTDTPIDKVLRITFSAHLDSRGLRSSNLSLTSGPVQRYLFFYYDPISRQLVAWPALDLRQGTAWTLEIKEGTLGLDGSPARTGVVTRFSSSFEASGDKPFNAPSFNTDVKPIFQKYCISCHGSPREKAIGGLMLDSEAGIRDTAISEFAEGWPGWRLIAPSLPGQSYLLYKINDYAGVSGMGMPRDPDMEQAKTGLTVSEQQVLSDWIVSGATFFDPDTNGELGSDL